ncbi:MAG: vanadium-dependent haloperoxidase [Bacteroidetes bacterium]|nr:vanadium-dependent haloperoxidase [Bacteroidota bacterium]
MRLRLFLPISVIILAASCSKKTDHSKITLNNFILSDCNTAIQNAIVVDHVSAPAGGRRYFYACAAAYEALVPFQPGYRSLAGQFRGLEPGPKPDTSKGYCLDLVALAAHTFASKKLVYKEDSINNFRERKLKWYKDRISEDQFENSIAYGDSVGMHIIRWAKKDTFDQIRGRDFYNPSGIKGRWEPTSPDFSNAVEPNWRRIRPVLIPSANAFKIPNPEPFSRDKNSRFYTITKQVYDEVQLKDSNHLRTALYWDDNPNTMVHRGHITVSLLKVSPAGHWLGMMSTLSKQQNFNLMQSAEGFVRFSAVMFDAFIACWDAKYQTDYIRPETAIRLLIDSNWSSPIQTPAFPEYPSGHSVVSTSVGTMSDTYYGKFEYIDSAELEFGLGTRKFTGILDASKEACISRLYGGIHFIDAIENGKKLGQQVGEYHLKHLITKE